MRKIPIYIIFILTISSQCFCQSGYSFGINFSPSLTVPSAPELADIKGKFNYSFGISGLFCMSEKIFLKTGINYTQKSYIQEHNPDTRNALVDAKGNTVIDIKDLNNLRIDPNRISYFDYIKKYQSISIPVIFNYKSAFNDQDALVYSAGIEQGFLYKIQGSLNLENKEEVTWTENMHNWTTSLTIGFGWYHQFSDKFLLFLSPKYSYDFYPAQNDLTVNFQTLSVAIDMLYNIK